LRCPTSSIIRANTVSLGQINSIAGCKHKHFKKKSVLELKKKSQPCRLVWRVISDLHETRDGSGERSLAAQMQSAGARRHAASSSLPASCLRLSSGLPGLLAAALAPCLGFLSLAAAAAAALLLPSCTRDAMALS